MRAVSNGGTVVASLGMVSDRRKRTAHLALSDPDSREWLVDIAVAGDEGYVEVGNSERPHVGITSEPHTAGVTVAHGGGNVVHRPDAFQDDAPERTCTGLR